MAKFTNPRDRGELTDAPEPEETAAPTQGVDIAAIVQAAVSAALAAGNQNSADLAKAITQGMEQVKEPIPENKIAPQVSDMNPLGDRDNPRPGLRRECFYGVFSDKDKPVMAAWEIKPKDASAWEQLALNMLTAGEKTIKALDGNPILVRITDDGKRLVIGLENRVIGKNSDKVGRNMVPPICEIVRQVTGHDFRPESLSLETLKHLMAEHRAKRYVGPTAAVAA